MHCIVIASSYVYVWLLVPLDKHTYLTIFIKSEPQILSGGCNITTI